MIYRVRFSPEFVMQHFVTGAKIQAAEVLAGLPKGCRLFAVFPNKHGEWVALFEGPHDTGTEGVIEERQIVFRAIDPGAD